MRFPLFALLAPVATSLVLWLVTSSPYTLLFAAMGPVMALASYGDGRLGDRRRRREEAFEADIVRERDEAASWRERSAHRRELRQAHPAPNELARFDALARPPWREDVEGASEVRLGLMQGDGAGDSRDNLVPLVIGASEGITAVGHPVLSLAVARGVWSQLAWNLSPRVMVEWGAGFERRDFSAAASWPMRLVESTVDVSPSCRYVIDILSPDEARLSDRDDATGAPLSFIPDFVSGPEASALARRLAATSVRVEQAHPDAQLPSVAFFSDLFDLPGAVTKARNSRASLAVPVGVGARGQVFVDLVNHGPHAIVAGMTGTGKTEFLVSWMLASVKNFVPTDFTFLVIDFKGGSGFARLAALPHCMGIVTDLDVPTAARALHSLRAELRYRERVLNEGGVTDIAALPAHIGLARLVILVDEYRALLDCFSELKPLFDDIAARGRALGMHLILGTQRATGVIAEGVLANCALRVAFRVNNVADSVTLLEADVARSLPEIPGRAMVRGIGLPLQCLQGALAGPGDDEAALAAAQLWSAQNPLWRARRPWLEVLPASVTLTDLWRIGGDEVTTSEQSMILGLHDKPEEQSQSPCRYTPERDGHLLVTGAQGSGKSQLLELLASQAQAVILLGAHDAEAAWDRVSEIPAGTLLFVDDLESLTAQFSLEHRDAFMESLITVLRTGPSRGIFVVMSTHSAGVLSSLWLPLMKSVLTLTGPAGRGKWQNDAIQIACLPESFPLSGKPAGELPVVNWLPGRDYVVVTQRPRVCLATLATTLAAPAESAGGGSRADLIDVGRYNGDPLHISTRGKAQIFVGDVEDWQTHYALLAHLRTRATFVFDDCSPSEVRAVRRSRDLLPHTRRGMALSLSEAGVATRVCLL